jgi:hypothetical protein
VRGLEGVLDHAHQVPLYGVEVDGLAQAGGERGHQGLGVVAGPVEPPVDHPLHAPAQRVEQRRGDQRRRVHGHRGPERQHVAGQDDEADVHAAEQRRDQRVGDHPADDPAGGAQEVSVGRR